MKGIIIAVLVGVGLGGLLAYRAGKAVARAQRAWNDYKATVAAIKGLFRRTGSMYAKAVRHVTLLFGAVGLLVFALWTVSR